MAQNALFDLLEPQPCFIVNETDKEVEHHTICLNTLDKSCCHIITLFRGSDMLKMTKISLPHPSLRGSGLTS